MMNNFNKYSLQPQVKLDDALAQIGFGKFNYILILLTGVSLGCVFLETVCINIVLPIATCDLNLTTTDKGMLSAIGFVGIILSSHLWGFLADTRGRKNVIVPTLFIAFVLSLISSFAKSFWFLLLMRFLNGFFISGPSATVYAYLGEFHSTKIRSKVLMYGSTIFAITCFWNPISATIFINQEWSFYISFLDLMFKPWRLFLIICSLPTLACAISMLLIIPESPKFTFSQGDEKKTLDILERIYIKNTGNYDFRIRSLVKDEEFMEVHRKSKNVLVFMWEQTKPLFQHPHLKNTLRACFIQLSIFNSSNGFWTFFPEISNAIVTWKDKGDESATICEIFYASRSSSGGSNGTEISTIGEQNCLTKLELSTFYNFFLLNFLYAGGWLLISFIIHRIGKLIIISSILFTSSACAILLMFVTNSTVSNILYVCLLAVGLALTVLNASTVELFPTQYRAMAVCLSLMAGRIGAVLGSNFIGLMMDNYCQYTFLMPTILLITSACLTFTIPNISKRN